MKRASKAAAWLTLPFLPVLILAGHAVGRLLALQRR